MALDLLNVGDSRATTKAKLDATFAEVGLPASGDTTEATDTFNQLVANHLVDSLPGLTDGMAGSTARSRINAAITALNEGRGYNYFITDQTGFDNLTITDGMRIGVRRGITIRGGFDLSGVSNVLIEPYGVGDMPKFLGSIQHTSGWSNVSGDVWEKDIGYTALNAFVVDGDTVTKLNAGTYASLTDGQFGTSGTTLQVRIGAGIDPNAIVIEVNQLGDISTGNGVYFSAGDNNSVKDIRFWFFGYNGAENNNSGTGNLVEGCSFAYNSNDGVGVHGTAQLDVLSNFIHKNGQVQTTSGSAGDGVSYHDTSSGLVAFNTITENEKQAVGNQPSTAVVVEFNLIARNYMEIVILGTAGTAKGEQDIRYNIIIWLPDGQSSGFAAINVASSTNRPNVRIYNNTIYCDGDSGSGQAGVRVAGGDVILKNNIINGFSRGIDHRSTDEVNASLDNDYNCMHGNTTQYFNNGTPGVTAGTNDITTDPQFTNAANDNFNIAVGSPCRGGGVDLGFTRDYVGTPVTNPPDIGALQYVA